ncbi:MAG TPA: sigma-70 family RNA polymerase sigma factor [Candidatus Sulfopaludibacter sp.]|jgi:RNA polymerase sigma factor (TIGR02999 family)|nr:sigma-70 family RNA polymerase sigma factor [Candidatus Sulfopaludibacter sp.]
MGDVAALLLRWREDGDKTALDEMLPAVYDELRRLAKVYLSRERDDHTLQPTELVHEAYMRLIAQREVNWRNRAHFLGVAAQVIRRVLLHHAESRSAQKRDGYAKRVSLDRALECFERDTTVDVLSLDAAMNRLAEIDGRQAQIVELRVFGGLTIEEAAEVMELSPATVKRDWSVARLYLRKELS